MLNHPVWLALSLVLLALLATLWRRLVALRRQAFIREAPLPPGLFDRLRRHHPGLTPKECQLVAQGLRQFFLAHLRSGRRFVSMPSQVVDDLWHEFILYTRHYERYCGRAFGRMLHHTPAVVLSPDRRGNEGLRRCWWWACREELIDPRRPSRLPLLFALDAKLGIAGGFRYVPDCGGVRRDDDQGGTYCGGDFASSAFDGGAAGFGDGDGGGHGHHGSGDGASDGGGDGGGGCGGGGD